MSDASPKSVIYIAYARADAARVEPVVTALKARGAQVHFDAASAQGSGSYVQMSQQALQQAQSLVVFISAASARSPWVESEARTFQAQMARGGGRRLIPVRLDDTPLPLAFASYQAIDGAGAAPDALAGAILGGAGAAAPAGAMAASPAAPEPVAPVAPAVGSSASRGTVYAAFARADAARVAPIVAALRADGWNVDFDPGSMHGGGDYVRRAQRAISGADGLVVFESAASARSSWVEWEARTFQAQMARGGGRRLVPVRLDESPVSPALAGYPTVDSVNAAPATVAATIGHYLTAAPEAPAAPAVEEAPVEEAERVSSSWEAPYNDVDFGAVFAPSAGSGAAEMEENEPAAPPPPPPPPPAPAAPPVAEEPFIVPAPAPGPITQPKGQPAPEPAAQPGRTTGAPAPRPTSTGDGAQERVVFTAYHPKETQPQKWQPLIVYLSLDSPATMALVASAAAERLAGKLDQYRAASGDRPAGLQRGAALRIIPSMAGFQFNPDHLDVKWQEDVQQHEFRMRATSADAGRAANGVVQVYQGLLLRAEIPISVFVGQGAARPDSPDAYQQAIARAYRKVFASYSHKDTPVVESCETAARTMGDNFLRDVNLLQAGVEWDPRLIQAINEADVFQLFWSKRAASSPYVEREWQHALRLLPMRENFIRPVYWSSQVYTIPPELNALHFQRLSLTSLGWGWARRFFYGMGNG